VAVAAVGLLVWLQPWRWGGPAEAPPTSAAPTGEAAAPSAASHPAVAVLGFKNLGRPEADWLSTAISEMLRTELAAGGRIRTVPGESVARVRLELKLAAVDSLAPDTLARIRRLCGADFVVLGSYLSLGQGGLRVDLRLQDAQRGELLASSSAEGTEDGLFEVVSQAGVRLREALALGEVSTGDALAARASFPADPEAGRLYAEGLARLRVFDARDARALLEKAAAREPTHPLVRAALASAWSALGYDGRARAESKQAVELAAGLPRAERLEVQALDAELSGDWPRAGEMYRALLVFFPDRIEYGLRLANAQVAAGKPKGALETVEGLRRLPEPGRSDPRIDLAEAGAAKALTDFEGQQRAAAAAAAKSQKDGAVLLFAQARLSESSALLNLGRLDEARQAATQARELFAVSGDLGSAARARNVIAVSFAMRGQFAEARALFQEALEEFRRIGDQRGLATQLENVAGAELRLGHADKARALFEQAISVARETGDVSLAARSLSNLATTLEESGDLDGALRRHEEALAAWRKIQASANEAVTLANIGEVRFKKKQLGPARQSLEESLAVARKAGVRNEDTAWAQGRLAAVLVAQGELGPAEAALNEAIAIYRATGATAEEAQSLRSLSEIRARLGNAAGAREAAADADKLEKAAQRN
jgi:tetratricopeptide (TPR) repeat protein